MLEEINIIAVWIILLIKRMVLKPIKRLWILKITKAVEFSAMDYSNTCDMSKRKQKTSVFSNRVTDH